MDSPCPACDGEGAAYTEAGYFVCDCPECDGTGRIVYHCPGAAQDAVAADG